MRFARDEDESIEVQMAPLVDIVFLLLVFFMCSVSFVTEESELKISLPAVAAAVAAEELPDEVLIHVRRGGRVLVNEKEYDSAESKELPELRDMLSRLASVFKDQNVIIQADDRAMHGRVVDVLNACVASGVVNISFYMP